VDGGLATRDGRDRAGDRIRVGGSSGTTLLGNRRALTTRPSWPPQTNPLRLFTPVGRMAGVSDALGFVPGSPLLSGERRRVPALRVFGIDLLNEGHFQVRRLRAHVLGDVIDFVLSGRQNW
jgi:hypothetical protein